MRDKQRIQGPSETFGSAVEKVVEGNIGALTTLLKYSGVYPEIDPDSALRQLGPVLDFDAHGIWGSRIWEFFKDVCECNFVKMAGVLRAVQLGILRDEDLDRAIDSCRCRDQERFALDIPDLLAKVKAQLPSFNDAWMDDGVLRPIPPMNLRLFTAFDALFLGK